MGRALAGVAALVVLLCAAGLCAEPSAGHAAVEAFFNSPDPFVRQTVLPNIEKNRKSDCTLELVDAQGAPAAKVKITGRLKEHRFLFGACPPESKADLDPKFIAAWAGLSNYGVAQNAMKWGNVEKEQGQYDFGRIDQMLDLCTRHGVVLEYHFLTGYHPAWLAALPPEEQARCQRAFARAILDRYRDKIAFFQVYNEDWLTHIARAKVYFDQTEFFAELVRDYPAVKFGVCDCWSIDTSYPLPDPEELKQRYPGISYVAAHAHKPRRLWPSPKEMYENFDKYLGSEVKIHLTEYGIDSGQIEGTYRQGTWTEETKAECFVQVRAVAFSHPAVESINHWDMGPGVRSRTYNAMLNDDLSPKPAYAALDELIHDRLTTALKGQSDEAGRYRFRGFHGQYEITVEDGAGHKTLLSFTLAPESCEHRLVVAGTQPAED
ncbi:MAG: endo-1,4-beta-xylanase [Thermoguttaceae bacterium]